MDYSVTLKNYKNLETINKNIQMRNKTNGVMEPNIDFRPVSTKYAVFPIHSSLDKVYNHKSVIYNSNNTFYPGDRKPHFSGFATNIDVESSLHNRFFALQKDSRSTYIPSTESSLYTNSGVSLDNEYRYNNNKLLFVEEKFSDHNPNFNNNIGSSMFNNSTRIQLKNHS